MCGIAGILRRDGGTVDSDLIEPMLSAIKHRGPDDTGVWHDQHIALGHNRLSIIDLSAHARQPMLTRDAQGVLVYNGEIYNYRDLRGALENEGITFSSSGDAEVVLHSLHHWGPERSIPMFNGMFAFAYLDRRTNTLWLGRDRLGIKPLLVAQTDSEIVFASEAKALLQHPSISPRVDMRMFTLRLLGRQRESHKYLFEGIDAIEAGHWWKITDSGIENHCYAHVLQDLDVERLVAAGNSDACGFVDTLKAHLRRSVKLHLASDAPVAVMVSGGVDSSLIAAYAHECQPDLQGYVADVRSADSEGNQAQLACTCIGMPVHRVLVDRERFLRLWPLTVWHSDGASYHPSDPALLAVTQQCHADGIKVLLTGEGSDELFGGYPFYAETYRRWHALYGPGFFLRRHLKRRRGKLAILPFCSLPGGKLPELQRRMIVGFDANSELLPYRIMELLKPVRKPADRALLAHTLTDLYDHLSWILHRHDRMGMAASMEMRVPFLENNLFDFAFHLPRRAKLHRGICKWVVKKAAEEHFPKKIVHAVKKGFPVPGELYRGTSGLLEGGLLAERMKWTSRTVKEVMNLIEQGGAALRFHVIGLELWLRLFFAHQEVDELGERLMALTTDSV